MKQDIRTVKSIEDWIRYFSDNLGWDIDFDDFDLEYDTYEYTPEELGLKEESCAKIQSLRQLPPLASDQQWGIFCVEFSGKRFEITALRRILSGLIPRKRNLNTEFKAWNLNDLLFICSWGEGNETTLGLAHFEQRDELLPQLKVIYCAPAKEDTHNIKTFEERISRLAWPSDPSDTEGWRENWSAAFTSGYRQTIHAAAELTRRLAEEARAIRDRILNTLAIETEQGFVHGLYNKFKEQLIHDLDEEKFADMYAQTLVYGLFSARCMDDSPETFSAKEALEHIPNTNPFLKSLLAECIDVKTSSGISFDELEVGNVVDILAGIDPKEIVQDFGRQTGGGREDPVLHFYEEFLNEYDKSQKVQRGVYYTPQPVVNFIVRAVDDILKNEFGLKDGLASTETKFVEMPVEKAQAGKSGLKIVMEKVEVPAVQVLDPATGTGTFLRQVILTIYENFKAAHKGEPEAAVQKAWNEYVPKHLLPRVNGFELMMAPYAVAHMKLAMVLQETGYDFHSDKRLQVYLTNTLEEPGDTSSQISFLIDPLSMESIEANGAKRNVGINVIIGNPPYNVSSTNKNKWITDLLAEYKRDLTERKLNLDDDYIKFLRFAQVHIDKTDFGIVCFISNNSFIDGITHRQIRKSLMETFSSIYIMDLHGNIMKHEKSPDASKDENVFDITQGVSISLMIKNKINKNCKVYHSDLFGLRTFKYNVLNSTSLHNIKWTELNIKNEKSLFVPFNSDNESIYKEGISVSEIFNLYNSGIQTKCDSISIQNHPEDIQNVINMFTERDLEDLKKYYFEKNDSSGWTFEKAKAEILGGNYEITPYYYRPFDVKYTLYTGKSGGFIGRSREIVMQHIVGHKDNLGLCMMKQFFQDTLYNHVLVSNLPIDERTLYSNRGGTYFFPLYVYSGVFGELNKNYNFTDRAINAFEKTIGKKLDYYKTENTFTGKELVYYIYGILYAPKYRNTYNEYLKYDFPRIPLPKDANYFYAIAKKGEELVRLHHPDNFYRNGAEDIVISELNKYSFDKEDKKIVLNNDIKIPVKWNGDYDFEMGGYKPLQKWLKDRKGNVITTADIEIINRIVYTIEETKRIMDSIDIIIDL